MSLSVLIPYHFSLDTLKSLALLLYLLQVLPELLKALEFGGAGTAAMAPILKIGQRLSGDDFAKVRILCASFRGLVRFLTGLLHSFFYFLVL